MNQRQTLFFTVFSIGLSIVCYFFIINSSHREVYQDLIVKYAGLTTLQEREVEFLETIEVEGYPLGTDFVRDETYVMVENIGLRLWMVKIVDIRTGKIKREVHLPSGPSQLPNSFFNPSYLESLDHHFYILDRFDKIEVLTDRGNYQFSSDFKIRRSFIDFYKHQGQVFFVAGCKQYGHHVRGNVVLYRLLQNDEPKKEKIIFSGFETPSVWSNEYLSDGDVYKWFFYPVLDGFEKKGKLYYARGNHNAYYRYWQASGYHEEIRLDYLKKKRFSTRQAEVIGAYKSGYFQTQVWNENGKNLIYRAYPGPIDHFGLYPVGADKIGIIGDIFLDKMEFRVDVFSCHNDRYVWSIRLPFSVGFIEHISSNSGGFWPSFIDVDKGVYTWFDSGELPGKDKVNITHFRVK